MAYNFGDSFDLYAAPADAINGYWDNGALTSMTLVAGRFTGSRALSMAGASSNFMKSSGANDAVHHMAVSYEQTAVLSGATLGAYLELFDGATAQCSIVFRSDGAILLTSGGPTGTVLDTFTGAVAAASTWYGFEFEVVINNTTGSWAVRKNGNTVNDHSLGSLNTRGSANNYANKLTLGMNAAVSAQVVDDLFWQSGAATGAWLGDIRCYTRMPASDVSIQFSKLPITQTPITAVTVDTPQSGYSHYTPVTPAFTGTVNTVSAVINAGFTGNLKCSVFNDAAGSPGTVLASATTIANPVTGSNTFTFTTPFAIVRGTQYWIGFAADGTYTNAYSVGTGTSGRRCSTVVYTAFPTASPAVINWNGVVCSWVITTGNFGLVNEAQEDGATSYVYDSNPGDADFYSIGSISSTPATVIATTIRGYAQKSDAGARTAAVQLKSGVATVASPTLVLSSSGWVWAWRTDLVDPNTGATWTAVGVNNAQIGPMVVA